jgi:3-ketosteroid 9alpha-monooxygenase subunit B
LQQLSSEYAERLVVLHWLESVQGLPSLSQLTELARPFAGYEAFVCGPAPFMDAVTTALAGLGLPRGRVHVERFLSLAKNPFAAMDEPEITGDGRVATVRVTLDGEQHTVAWPAERRLLDVLLDQGIDAPYSCREGRCSACACRKRSGEVKLLHNEVLEDEDLREGYILACQSVPVTDTVEITYD